MPCTSPLPAWRPKGAGGQPKIEKGGFANLAQRAASGDVETFKLDCGGCLSCRIAKQRDLAVRAYHETLLHGEEKSWFLTLTYADEFLPFDRGLNKRDLQLFLKRFRKANGAGLKYMACGEYGDFGTRRAHYHIALWGHEFKDRRRWKMTPPKYPGGPRYWLYRSKTLEKAWTDPSSGRPIGHAWLGALTYSSAAYVAAYTTKKLTGSKSYWHYLRADANGDVGQVAPEFVTVSRGGRTGKGLGYEYYRRFYTDLFPKDFVVHPKTGRKLPVPKYYRRKLEQEFPDAAAPIKAARIAFAEQMQEDSPELRRARHDTLVGLRTKIYGHPDDSDHVDEAGRAALSRLSGRALEAGDYTALSRDVHQQKATR